TPPRGPDRPPRWTADRLHPDARTGRGLTTLLPGESTVLQVDNWTGADLTTALRCVNSSRAKHHR
ncbi:hypothetical protein ACFRKE_18715, partial [Kitasatospora indigofera]|uniref:hypothetical protein n=1 Tax=Kitasatospora indigofera TaxID=67307 RepID=UPI003688AEEE